MLPNHGPEGKRPRAVPPGLTAWWKRKQDSVSYRKAIEHPRLGKEWSDAVDEELLSLDENSTWDYIQSEDVPAGVEPIGSKWVFKTKQLPRGGIRHNARLMIHGFKQKAGVDFHETFAPVVNCRASG